MTDTIRSQSQLLTNFASNSIGAITAQNIRDFVVTSYSPQDPITNTVSPSASISALTLNGTLLTGGTGTTNLYFYKSKSKY